MTYINKDYYDYISKIDNTDSPLHDIYQEISNFLLEEGLDQQISNETMEMFVRMFELKSQEENKTDVYKLYALLNADAAFRRTFENENGSYTVYPKLKETPDSNDLLKYYSLKLKMDIPDIIKFLKPKLEANQEKFKKAKLENYYGSPKYLIIRTKAIQDAITLLNKRDDIQEKDLLNTSFTNVTTLLNEMLNTVGLENKKDVYSNLEDYLHESGISRKQYDIIREKYIKVLDQEKTLIDISAKIWQTYAEENQGVFIHQLTGEAVESDKISKICVSFCSKNTSYITDYLNGNIGYAYPMDIKNAFVVCDDDAGSWQVSKEEWIENSFKENWQFDETNLFYENPYNSRLFPPEYIEEKINENGSFAESVLDNRTHKIKPLYCFYTMDATEEQIRKINSLAEQQGLEVKELKRNEKSR